MVTQNLCEGGFLGLGSAQGRVACFACPRLQLSRDHKAQHWSESAHNVIASALELGSALCAGSVTGGITQTLTLNTYFTHTKVKDAVHPAL